jgi:uncharacterized coiled-coil protein SlyX
MSSPEGNQGRPKQLEKRKIKLMKTRLKIFTTVLSVLACCAFLPTMQAQLPPEIPGNPDGCYPAFTTAEGCNALHQLFGGLGNTAVGWYANFLAGNASFNTSVGAGALALDSGVGASSNTALGTAAMILNLTGNQNVAVGINALVNNATGSFNNGVGAFVLYNNDSSGNGSGSFNNAFGTDALFSNVDGIANSAFGDAALENSTGVFNTALGASAGTDITVGNNINVIGTLQSGIDSDLGEVDNSTYISNIFDQPVSSLDATLVFIDSSGKLGTVVDGNKVPVSSLIGTQKQAMSNRKIEELQATVARQQKQIDALTAGLQKVSAQLEVSKPAPQVVTNKP